MVTYTFKIFQCQYCQILKACLTIFNVMHERVNIWNKIVYQFVHLYCDIVVMEDCKKVKVLGIKDKFCKTFKLSSSTSME